MDTEERQRRRVSRAIKLELAPIAEKNPELARLLKETIKTGTHLSYMAVVPHPAPQRECASDGEKASASSLENPIRG